MLGIGWTEMLVVGVVALIVIGPKDLPMVMQKVGRFMGSIRRMGNEFQREINRTTGLDEVRNLRNSITQPLKQTSDEIRREFNAMTPSGPKPSGAIKPADPKAESVVDEIRAAAGMEPREAATAALPAAAAAPATAKGPVKAAPRTSAKTAATGAATVSAKTAEAASPEAKSAQTSPAATKPAKRRAPAKARPAPTTPVTASDLPPVAPQSTQASEPTAPLESPAPAEAVAPAAKPARKRAPRKSPPTDTGGEG